MYDNIHGRMKNFNRLVFLSTEAHTTLYHILKKVNNKFSSDREAHN